MYNVDLQLSFSLPIVICLILVYPPYPTLLVYSEPVAGLQSLKPRLSALTQNSLRVVGAAKRTAEATLL